MTDEKGAPVLIDPAVAFGHREADIAMSQLFGGFDADFYTAYNEVFPMEEGWQSRMDIYNLYPLMIHVNLFGEGYVGSVKSILKRFVG
jgi:fructosamine-3-kinase